MNMKNRLNFIVPLAYIATGIFIGASMQSHSDGAKTRVPNMLRARNLEIVDSKGRPRIVLATADEPDGNATIAIKQPDGDSSLHINSPKGNLILTKGSTGLILGPDDNGEPEIIYFNKNREPVSVNLAKSQK